MKIKFPKIEVTIVPIAGPYIDSVIWKFPDDGEYTEPVVLDRTKTNYEYSIENGKSYLEMNWEGVYIWENEKQVLIPEKYKDGDYVKGSLLGIEINREDAPKGYGIIGWEGLK